MDQQLKDYRDHLVSASQKAQEEFDKTILYLSGGAMGVSFAFITDVLGNTPWEHPNLLLIAWITWGCSMCCVLFSFYASNHALRKTIEQVDNNTVYDELPGGNYRRVTEALNVSGGILFLAGVAVFIAFVAFNIG